MIQITAQMRVLVAIEPVDGRKGIDSLTRLCQDKLQEDPFSGCVFVFRSRSGAAIRLLTYDGQGYWLAQKRLSKGRFVWWPEATGPAKGLEAYAAACLTKRHACSITPFTSISLVTQRSYTRTSFGTEYCQASFSRIRFCPRRPISRLSAGASISLAS